MTIEASLIVKNEEELLPRALDSIKGIDLITIADTGSEDSTVEIAKKYTDKVYTDFKWCDHFAKARNYSLSKCTGDWILIIDADEQLKTEMSKVRDIVEKADKEGHVFINVKVRAEGDTGENVFPRLFKRIPEIEWNGAAHNYLSYKGQSIGRTYNSDIVVEYGYSPAHKKDPDRTLRILAKVIEDNPESTRERYYLAREYFYRQNWDMCIKHLDEYLKRSQFLGERNDAWLIRAYCLSGLKKYNEACDSAWQALKYNANFKEALLFLANHMDPINKEAWKRYAQTATNENVLFIREVQ